MVGDFLIESQCRRGHKSTATFHDYDREHVEDVARSLSDRCPHPDGVDGECEQRVSHVVIAIRHAATPPPPSSRRTPPPPRVATKPSMQAVSVADPRVSRIPVVIVDDSDGEQSTEPPPPTRDDCD